MEREGIDAFLQLLKH